MADTLTPSGGAWAGSECCLLNTHSEFTSSHWMFTDDPCSRHSVSHLFTEEGTEAQGGDIAQHSTASRRKVRIRAGSVKPH